MVLTAGTRLGPYEILSPIGAGGMGEIYRARDPRLKRDVAIKVLPRALAADEAAVAPFEREAKVITIVDTPTGRRKVLLSGGDRQSVNQFWRVSLTRDNRRIAVVSDQLEGNLWTIRDK